jgi:uncharacterized protein YndB with AHSA1/START domain
MNTHARRICSGALLCCLVMAPAAHAEVKHADESSFTISLSATTKATPEQAWNAMTRRIPEWWSAEHSWSGDAKNFYMRAELGGCFCEHLPSSDGGPAGGVEHLRIMYIKPFEVIRFDGTLGPMVDMPVQGRMSWAITPAVDATSGVADGSSINFTYHVHGYMEGGFAGLAPVVDGVIGQQLQRLQVLLEQ